MTDSKDNLQKVAAKAESTPSKTVTKVEKLANEAAARSKKLREAINQETKDGPGLLEAAETALDDAEIKTPQIKDGLKELRDEYSWIHERSKDFQTYLAIAQKELTSATDELTQLAKRFAKYQDNLTEEQKKLISDANANFTERFLALQILQKDAKYFITTTPANFNLYLPKAIYELQHPSSAKEKASAMQNPRPPKKNAKELFIESRQSIIKLLAQTRSKFEQIKEMILEYQKIMPQCTLLWDQITIKYNSIATNFLKSEAALNATITRAQTVNTAMEDAGLMPSWEIAESELQSAIKSSIPWVINAPQSLYEELNRIITLQLEEPAIFQSVVNNLTRLPNLSPETDYFETIRAEILRLKKELQAKIKLEAEIKQVSSDIQKKIKECNDTLTEADNILNQYKKEHQNNQEMLRKIAPQEKAYKEHKSYLDFIAKFYQKEYTSLETLFVAGTSLHQFLYQYNLQAFLKEVNALRPEVKSAQNTTITPT